MHIEKGNRERRSSTHPGIKVGQMTRHALCLVELSNVELVEPVERVSFGVENLNLISNNTLCHVMPRHYDVIRSTANDSSTGF